MPRIQQRPTISFVAELRASLEGVPKNNYQTYTDDLIIDAIISNAGIITKAAEALGCSSASIYDRMKKSERVAEVIHEIRIARVDNAISQLDLAVQRGEPWAVSLVLKTLGKDMGFTERTEITGKEGSPLFDNQFVTVIEHGSIDQPEDQEADVEGTNVIEGHLLPDGLRPSSSSPQVQDTDND